MKAQSGIEYMLIIGFVSFIVIAILVSAYFYINLSKDRIRVNQLEILSTKIISSAESIFYAGYPSQATITIYVPQGVQEISLDGYTLYITFSTSTGTSKIASSSKVPLEGTISPVDGSKRITVKAESDRVVIS